MGRSNMHKRDGFTGTAEPNNPHPEPHTTTSAEGTTPTQHDQKPARKLTANQRLRKQRGPSQTKKETPVDEEPRRKTKSPQKGHVEEAQQKGNSPPQERDPRDGSTCGGLQRGRAQGPKEEAEPQGPEQQNLGTQDQTDPPERRRTWQEEEDPQNPKEWRHPEWHEPRRREWKWSQAVPTEADVQSRGAEAYTEGTETTPAAE